jgi:hypothetical protein
MMHELHVSCHGTQKWPLLSSGTYVRKPGVAQWTNMSPKLRVSCGPCHGMYAYSCNNKSVKCSTLSYLLFQVVVYYYVLKCTGILIYFNHFLWRGRSRVQSDNPSLRQSCCKVLSLQNCTPSAVYRLIVIWHTELTSDWTLPINIKRTETVHCFL